MSVVTLHEQCQPRLEKEKKELGRRIENLKKELEDVEETNKRLRKDLEDVTYTKERLLKNLEGKDDKLAAIMRGADTRCSPPVFEREEAEVPVESPEVGSQHTCETDMEVEPERLNVELDGLISNSDSDLEEDCAEEDALKSYVIPTTKHTRSSGKPVTGKRAAHFGSDGDDNGPHRSKKIKTEKGKVSVKKTRRKCKPQGVRRSKQVNSGRTCTDEDIKELGGFTVLRESTGHEMPKCADYPPLPSLSIPSKPHLESGRYKKDHNIERSSRGDPGTKKRKRSDYPHKGEALSDKRRMLNHTRQSTQHWREQAEGDSSWL